MRPYLKTPFTKTGLVEWLKRKALSSSPSTAKKKRKKEEYWKNFKRPTEPLPGHSLSLSSEDNF
jgi:ribosomal protein S21